MKTKLFYCIDEFLQKMTKNFSFRKKKCFCHQIELYTATLSFFLCFEAILKLVTKKLSIRLQNVFLNKLSHKPVYFRQNEQNTAKQNLFVVL